MTEKGLKEAMREFGIKSLGDRFRTLNILRMLKVNWKSIKPKESEEHKEGSDEEQEQEDYVEETVEETKVEEAQVDETILKKLWKILV